MPNFPPGWEPSPSFCEEIFRSVLNNLQNRNYNVVIYQETLQRFRTKEFIGFVAYQFNLYNDKESLSRLITELAEQKIQNRRISKVTESSRRVWLEYRVRTILHKISSTLTFPERVVDRLVYIFMCWLYEK